MISPGNLGQNLLQANSTVLKDTAANSAINYIAQQSGLPYQAVGYGQTPFIPMDSKLEMFNRYVTTLAQAYAQVGAITGNAAAGSAISGTIQSIADRIDLPLSARLIMFNAKDNSKPNWTFPLLVLPVNPDSFRVDYKKRSDLIYTLGGFVVTHWHDDVINITASGYIPSFQGKSKILTSSYQYFMQFLDLYLSCGKISQEPIVYESVPTTDTKNLLNNQLATQSINNPGGTGAINTAIPLATTTRELQVYYTSLQRSIIQLRYQDDIYNGIFTTFSINESAELPNTLQYTFTFKAMDRQSVAFDSLAQNTNPIDTIFGEGSTASDVKGLLRTVGDARHTFGAA